MQRWVPKMLKDGHKTKRMGSALNVLTRYAQEGDDFLDSIATGDEIWVFHHTPESKQQSLQWRHTHSPRTKNFENSVSVKMSWRPFSGTEKAFCWSTSCLLARQLTLILRRSRTGTVWFYTSTSNKREAWPKLYTKSLRRDLKRMYSRLTLVRISINL